MSTPPPLPPPVPPTVPAPPSPPPTRPTGALIVAAALIVVGLIVAAAIVFSGGSSDSDDRTTGSTDDTRERSDDTGPPATFVAPSPTSEPAPPTTRPPLSVAPTRPTVPVTTVPVTTVPPTTNPPATNPPATTGAPVFSPVVDDTGTFSVQVSDRFDHITTPLEIGTTVAHVSASGDLDGYLAGDFSIVGFSVLMAPTDVVGGIEGVLASFDPLDRCGRRRDDTTFLATVGSGVMRTFVQCDGDNAEVLIALEGSGMTTLVALQGPNPEIGLVEDTAAAIARNVAFVGG